jgi:mannose-1-phosphate guanylyltransferase
VQGKPLLSYWFELLFSSGCERVLINTHYLRDVVRTFIEESIYSNCIDIVNEDLILGTAGTILANASWFGGESFIVAHADNLTLFDVQKFIKRHSNRPEGCVITMMTFDTDSPKTCGIVEEDNGIVIAFYEKISNPPSNRANAAVYIFAPEVIQFMVSLNKPVLDISTEVLPYFLGKICTYHNDLYHRDIGNFESLELAEREFGIIKRKH